MAVIFSQRKKETRDSGKGKELNDGASLSVWKGIMPVLNIAARLGRHTERIKHSVIYAS